MESRKNFYSKELNMERVDEAINYLASNLTLNEILKVIREISYDMVYYNDKTDCGVIYKDKRFNKNMQWQACRIQNCLRTMCDLFGQSVIDAREFDNKYLEKWLDGGYLQNKVTDLEEKIKKMEEENE